MLNHLYNDGRISAVEIAQIAQFAENEYFGKPCGLMDQMACSVGGFVQIDFNDPAAPVINKVDFDFASCNHALCIVDTGGNHADLTDEYAAVRGEMEAVAAKFGKSVLREVDIAEFEKNIPLIRESAGDRAVLRAMHFFNENRRVDLLGKALEANDFEAFKALIIESGFSSYMYNQNVFTCKAPSDQPVSVALAICQDILSGKGFYCAYGEKVAVDNAEQLCYYVRGEQDAWLQENTAESCGDAVLTKPVSVSHMHAWLKAHPDAFIAALNP
jgi:galactokinase